MANTNIKLSKEELALATNADFILTKNRIITKVIDLFGLLYKEYEVMLKNENNIFSNEILDKTGKISKGENYKMLPYVLLDYPRCFLHNNTFAIRSFFWWGNFFSITLHLSGKFALYYASNIVNNICSKNEEGWFICINENEWEHHFEEDNYKPLPKDLLQDFLHEHLMKKSFIKIAKKLPVKDWDSAYNFYAKSYADIIIMLKN